MLTANDEALVMLLRLQEIYWLKVVSHFARLGGGITLSAAAAVQL